METKFRKTSYGYEAVTEIPLPGVKTASPEEGDEAVLRISTSKRGSGALATSASVVSMKPSGTFSFMLTSDFSMTYGVIKTRCTEKAVREYHARADLALIEAAARAFYEKKEAA